MHLPGPVSVPQASLPATVCGAQKAVTYEILSVTNKDFPRNYLNPAAKREIMKLTIPKGCEIIQNIMFGGSS